MRTVHNVRKGKVLRKLLRNTATPQEILLWSKLKGKQLGYKFRRQHGIGNYIVDFYCPEKNLIVELDGIQHGETAATAHDEERTAYFQKLGYVVLRFWNNEINTNLGGVLLQIEDTLNHTTP